MTRIYCGDDEYLKGEPAMVYAVAGTPLVVIAVFHNSNLRRGSHHYGRDWHVFSATDFEEPTDGK